MKKSIIVLSLAVAFSAHAKTTHPIVDGHLANASGISPIAVGTNAQTKGGSSIAIGTNAQTTGNASTAIGMQAEVTGNLSTAVGPHAIASSSMATALGSDAQANGESSGALIKGARANGKASVAVGAHAETNGVSAAAFGLHARADGAQSVAIGQSSKAKGAQSAAFGSGAQSSERFSTAIGTNAAANHLHGVALGSFSKTDAAVGTSTAEVNGVKFGNFAGHRPTGNVSVGDSKAGSTRTVTNVAAGRVTSTSTDAVNGSQLHAVAKQAAENKNGLDRLRQVQKEMQENFLNNRKETYASAASGVAHANLMQPHAAGQWALSAGVGHYHNEQAGALGVSYITQSGKWGFRGGVGYNTNDKFSAGLGLAYFIGGVSAPVKEVHHHHTQEVVVREVAPAPVKEKRIRQ